MHNPKIDRLSCTARLEKHTSFSIDSNQVNPYTPKSFRQVDRDFYLLPLIIDKKFRLDNVKALSYVFLRLKANLSYHLRKKISAFKLARALQNAFINVEIEAFYTIKSGIREPSEMPFTRQIGNVNHQKSTSISTEHSNREIIQICSNGSFQDIDEIRDVNKGHIEDIIKSQEFSDIITYVLNNHILAAKLEAFNELKAFMLGSTFRSFQSGRIKQMIETSTPGGLLTLQRDFLLGPDSNRYSSNNTGDFSHRERIEEGFKKLHSGIKTYRDRTLEGTLDRRIIHEENNGKYDDLDLALFNKRPHNQHMDSQQRTQSVESQRNSLLRSSYLLKSGYRASSTSLRESPALPQNKRRFIQSEQTQKDLNEEFHGLPKTSSFNETYLFPLAKGISPIQILTDYKVPEENQNQSSRLMTSPKNTRKRNRLFTTSFDEENYPYSASRDYEIESQNNSHTKRSFNLNSGSRLHFGRSNFDLYVIYQPAISQIIKIYTKARKNTIKSAFGLLKQEILPPISKKNLLLLNLLIKKDNTIQKHKQRLFDRWRYNRDISGLDTLRTSKLDSAFKSILLRDLGESFEERFANTKGLLSLRGSEDKWARSSIKRKFLFTGSSGKKGHNLSFSKIRRFYGTSGGMSTERDVKYASIRTIIWRLEDAIERVSYQNVQNAFDKMKEILNSSNNQIDLLCDEDIFEIKSRVPLTLKELGNYHDKERLKEISPEKEPLRHHTFGISDLKALKEQSGLKFKAASMLMDRLENLQKKTMKECLGLMCRKTSGTQDKLKLIILTDTLNSILKAHRFNCLTEGFVSIQSYVTKNTFRISEGNNMRSRHDRESVYSSSYKGSRWSIDELKEEEMFATSRSKGDSPKILAAMIMYYILKGQFRNLKGLSYWAFARLRVYTSLRKLQDLNKTNNINTEKQIRTSNEKAKITQKVMGIVSKLRNLCAISALKDKGLAFNKIQRYSAIQKALYEDFESANLVKEAKLANLVKVLKIREELFLQLCKTQVFYKLANNRNKEYLEDLDLINEENATQREFLRNKVFNQKLHSIFKLNRYKNLSLSFATLKENMRNFDLQKETENENLRQALKSKIVTLFGKMLGAHVSKILKIKAWKKLYWGTLKGFSPRTELKVEKRRSKQKSLLYFLKTMSLIEKFQRKIVLASVWNKLRDLSKEQEIEFLHDRLVEDMQLQEITKVLLGGIACISKVMYHAEKKKIMNAFNLVKQYAKNQGKKGEISEQGKEKYKRSTKNDMVINTENSYRKTSKRQQQREETRETRETPLKTGQDESTSHDFRRKIYREVQRGDSQRKTLKLNYPGPVTTNEDFSVQSPSYQNNNSTTRILPSEDKNSHFNKLLFLNTSIRSPSPLKPLDDTPGPKDQISTPTYLFPIKNISDHLTPTPTELSSSELPSSTYRVLPANITLPKANQNRQLPLNLIHFRANSQEIHNKESAPNTHERKDKTERSSISTATVKYSYDLRNKQPHHHKTSQDASHMSSRLYNLVNFSFKPETKKAHLKLDELDSSIKATEQNVDANKGLLQKSSSRVILTSQLNTNRFLTGSSESKKVSTGRKNQSYVEESNRDLRLSKDINSFRIAYQGNVHKGGNNEEISRESILKQNTKKSYENYDPNILHKANKSMGNALDLTKSRPPGILTENHKKEMRERNLHQHQEPLRKNRLLLGQSNSFINKSNSSMRINKEHTQLTNEELLNISFVSQVSKQRNQSRERGSMCRDKSEDQCGFCGKELSMRDEYTVYKPAYCHKSDNSISFPVKHSNSMVVDGEKDIKTRILQKIMSQKIGYLEYEKKKAMGDLCMRFNNNI